MLHFWKFLLHNTVIMLCHKYRDKYEYKHCILYSPTCFSSCWRNKLQWRIVNLRFLDRFSITSINSLLWLCCLVRGLLSGSVFVRKQLMLTPCITSMLAFYVPLENISNILERSLSCFFPSPFLTYLQLHSMQQPSCLLSILLVLRII